MQLSWGSVLASSFGGRYEGQLARDTRGNVCQDYCANIMAPFIELLRLTRDTCSTSGCYEDQLDDDGEVNPPITQGSDDEVEVMVISTSERDDLSKVAMKALEESFRRRAAKTAGRRPDVDEEDGCKDDDDYDELGMRTAQPLRCLRQ